MKGRRPTGRRPDSVRAAIAKSREARLGAVERRLTASLRYLRRHDRAGYDALVAMLPTEV